MSDLNELATALAKAQGEIMPAPKDAENPNFRSKYASLPAIREAVREAFARHGLSVVQMPSVHDGQLRLKTVLLHASGQSLDCGTLSAEVDVKNCQMAGSAISYFRRYSLAAVAGVVSDTDDDANAASLPERKPEPVVTDEDQEFIDQSAAYIAQATSLDELNAFGQSLRNKSTAIQDKIRPAYKVRREYLIERRRSQA